MNKKIHYFRNEPLGLALCGAISSEKHMTKDIQKITCLRCRKYFFPEVVIILDEASEAIRGGFYDRT